MSSSSCQMFLPQDKITVLNKASRRSEIRKAIPQNSYYQQNWHQETSRPASNFEQLARGRFNFDKRIIKPQESRSRNSNEIEDAFIRGNKKTISIHGDRNWVPIVRRSPLLIDRENLPIN